jgi:glycosyltransferase involved in cell wall biosynthesis
LKILLYSDCFIFGGSENVIENLLKSDELHSSNQLVFFYAYNKRYKKAVEEKFKGYQNIYPVSILSAFSKWGYDAQLNKKRLSFDSLYVKVRYMISRLLEKTGLYAVYNHLKLYRIFLQQSPDVLYINNGGYPGAESCRIAVLSARKAGIKNIVFNVNNLALPQKGIIDKWMDNKINSFVKIFVTASKAAGEALIKERKFNISKCINIPNTLLEDTENEVQTDKSCLKQEFKIDNKEIILGTAGLLTQRKGFHVLIEAVNHLVKKRITSFKLFIFGEGEQREYLEDRIKEYRLEHIVFLPGYKNDLLQYIRNFDVFICPSIANEDFPYVILEAMLAGKPVIGTDIAGIPEQVINEYNGFIVRPNDAEMLADRIAKLLSDLALIKTMGANSYKRYAEDFTNRHIMQRYQQLFSSHGNNQSLIKHLSK